MKSTIKKCILCILLNFTFFLQAQIQFEAVDNYGQLENIVYDPFIEDKLYALTRGNHIVTSNDKGITWQVLYSYPENNIELTNLKHIPSSNVLSFSVKYSEIKNNIFLFDLDSNMVIKEFELPNYPLTIFDEVVAYDIYHENTNVIAVFRNYAIVNENTKGNIYYSVNGGESWSLIYESDNYNELMPTNVAIHPLNPNMIYLPTYEGLFLSENAGQSWDVKLEGIAVKEVSISPLIPSTVYLGTTFPVNYTENIQRIFLSNDYGSNWNVIPIEWNEDQSNSISKIALNPNNYNNVIIMDENEIIITNNFFVSYNSFVYTTYTTDNYFRGNHLSFNPFQSNELIINTDHYPMISQDGGQTLEFMRMPLYNVSQVKLFNNGNNSHLYYTVSNHHGILHKNLTDNQTQAHQIEDYYDIGMFSERVYYSNSQNEGQLLTFKVSFMNSMFEISNDHGESFTELLTLPYDIIYDLKVNPWNSNQAWVALMNGGLNVLDFEDLNNVTYTPVEIPAEDIVTSVLFHPTNPNEIFITDGIKVKKSIDGGINWVDISNGIELNETDILYDVSINPHNHNQMITTSNVDMYMTTDGGQNWEVVYNQKVREVWFSPFTNGHIAGAIHSIGTEPAQLVYSTDGGANWTLIPSEIIDYANSYSMDYIFSEDEVVIYIATLDLGLVSYTIDLSPTLSSPLPSYVRKDLKVYPNPVKDIVNIVTDSESPKHIAIYSTNGSLILKVPFSKSIDISELQSGIYFLKVITEENHNYIKRIIKK